MQASYLIYKTRWLFGSPNTSYNQACNHFECIFQAFSEKKQSRLDEKKERVNIEVMEIIATVVLSACISWLITDIKSKMHLKQIDKMLDKHLNNLKEVHDEYFDKLNQKCKF